MFLLDSSSNIQCTKNSITECNNLDLMMTVNYVSKGRLLLLLLVYKIQRRYSALCIQIRHTHTSLCMTLGWHPDVHFTNSFTFLVFTKALPHCSPSRVNLQHYKHRHPGMLCPLMISPSIWDLLKAWNIPFQCLPALICATHWNALLTAAPLLRRQKPLI